MTYKTNGSDSGGLSAPPSPRHLILDDIPDDFGLLLWLDSSSSSCYLTYCPDDNYHELHPNIYAPYGLENVRALCGGGSGVTVFEGDLPYDQYRAMLRSKQNRTVVMKHGSHKDTTELFALATIAHQLQKRCQQTHVKDGTLQDMQGRIPQFKYLYLSPSHFSERHRELWQRIKAIVLEFHRVKSREKLKDKESNGTTPNCNGATKSISESNSSNQSFGTFLKRNASSHENLAHSQRIIRVYSSGHLDRDNSGHARFGPVVTIEPDFVNILLEEEASERKTFHEDSEARTVQYGSDGNGYMALDALVSELLVLQRENSWKFTCAQTRIGGESPQTASSLLVKGNLLRDNLLPQLLDEFVKVVRNLQQLTLPQERLGAEKVVDELKEMKQQLNHPETTVDASSVSPLANSFVGGAIRKNCHPEHGRFIKLKNMAIRFRSNEMVLQQEEIEPAHFLGILLQQKSQMNHVFLDTDDTAILRGDMTDDWVTLLEEATTAPLDSAAAAAKLNRLWTCGFTDAGLHNLFLNNGKLWLFDLGKPSLQPLPSFLTKFLFSFFHTLGMEEDASGNWVKRFKTVQQKDGSGEKPFLALTDETKELLSQSYQAFDVVLDRFVKDLFHGDDTIRPLLIRYMTYQLISDASFCIEKWTIKGGGQEKLSSGHVHAHNEKWLWRALWDVYAAFDINTKTWT